MRIATYDIEVFAYDFLVVFKDKQTGKYTCIWNDNEAIKDCMSGDTIYVGFNSKFYDQHVLKGICCGFSVEEVKALNDFLIQGGQGWEYPPLQEYFFRFTNVDVKDDMQMGLSLKAIEGHLGLDIRESTVPFDIDRPLTEEERQETEFYCKHDVDTAEKILDLRKDYFQNKINIGRLAGIDEVKAMGMTNAKLTAALLKASPKKHYDEREYVYPDNLRKEFIPREVFEFFDKMHDSNLTDKEVFSDSLEIEVGGCPVKLAYGGIHGAKKNYIFTEYEQDGRKRIQENDDVGSYYPHLCTINGYTSRNIPSPKIYEDMLETRMKAKASGDTATANALKLVCNTTYGATLNQFNDLYDPLMGRSVCVSGQLYLLELAEHLVQDIEELEITQLNTDGIMFEFWEDQQEAVDEILKEWQERTGFELEADKIARLYQKDVNNYIEVQANGKAKEKGGYLVKGIAKAGAFNINNNACIVAKAIKEYFLNGTPVEDTILACNDITQFQLIAKAGVKYREAYHLVGDVKEPVQRVNRVYATTDTRYGKLFKVKAEDDSTAKIDSLPEHCVIDNDNHLTISDIDKNFYIDMAHKRVNDFKGIKPEKPSKRRTKSMATTKSSTKTTQETATMNVYQKLLAARARLLEAGIKQTGKNMHLSFKYFELEDIVPAVTRIFSEIGLIALDNFTADVATISIVNTDNAEEVITFSAPFNQISPIVSNAGKQATNEMQALGSSITYMRRYLYLIAMDICIPDDIDPNLKEGGDNTPAPVSTPAPAPAPKAPATPQEREEVKQELTKADGEPTELQIKQLKGALKKLREKDPSKEEMIGKIAVETEGFTKMTKSDCEKIMKRVGEMLKEVDNG